MSVIIKFLLFFASLVYGAYVSGSAFWAGKVLYLIPLAGSLVGLWYAFLFAKWFIANADKLLKLENVFQNLKFALDHSSQNVDAAKSFIDRLNVPHEEFKKNFR